MTDFAAMDNWSSEQVAHFKEQGKRPKVSTRSLNSLDTTTPGPTVTGPIVAEGDSWFDYLPGTDLIDCLRNHYDYEIFNYAKAGDTLENMIYGTRINWQFEPVSPTIDQVIERIADVQPAIFLFSGGGNDVAGESFESYLNHQDSGLPNLRQDYIEHMINQVFRRYFASLIDKVKAASPNTHIVTHGYGRTLPTGKGIGIFGLNFSGPWLRPALAKKKILDQTQQQEAVFTLINAYNQMLQGLADEYDRFHHVDLRAMLEPGDWRDELHLTNSAFARAAAQIHQTITTVISDS